MAAAAITAPDAPLRLAYPHCERGIGSVITNADSGDLIAGVRIEAASLWPDDRGYFLEVARNGAGLAGGLDPASVQTSAAVNFPGAIKAFHYHLSQTDYWAPVAGMFQVALVDLREESETFGRRNTLYAGDLRPWRIWIPPGVGHGYKVISQTPGVMVYLTSRHYDPSDEGRIAHDHHEIAYDWELQHK
jgi:dTDP-4-dehydrorhamnose 3,5-epimerase